MSDRYMSCDGYGFLQKGWFLKPLIEEGGLTPLPLGGKDVENLCGRTRYERER